MNAISDLDGKKNINYIFEPYTIQLYSDVPNALFDTIAIYKKKLIRIDLKY